MNPDDVLQKLRALTLEVFKGPTDSDRGSSALEMAEHFQALDLWITHGKELPKDWQKKDPQEGG